MNEPLISRGFRGRKRPDQPAGPNRVPPGQHLVTDFPVLSAGPTPRPNLDAWRFSLQHRGSLLGQWTWNEFQAKSTKQHLAEVTLDQLHLHHATAHLTPAAERLFREREAHYATEVARYEGTPGGRSASGVPAA